MADASAPNGPNGSSFHVSGSQLLVRTSPDPPCKHKACPRYPGQTLPRSEQPRPNAGHAVPRSLPEAHAAPRARGRWHVSAQWAKSLPSAPVHATPRHATRTMINNPTTNEHSTERLPGQLCVFS